MVDRFQNSLNGSVVSTFTMGRLGLQIVQRLKSQRRTLSAAQSFGTLECVEGQDLQQIAKGTSDAKAITLSFYVKLNKTGTYTAELDTDNSRLNVIYCR